MRGKSPTDPLCQSDVDLLDFTDQLEAVGQGAKIAADAPVSALTAVSFARVAECAVEQNTSILRQGSVNGYRRRTRKLMEAALAEECWLSGARHNLNTLLACGDISRATFEERTKVFAVAYDEISRKSAAHAANIMRDIEKRRERSGKGRPAGSLNGDTLAHLIDSAILKDAYALVPHSKRNDRNAIAAAIPGVVREYVRLGQLRQQGGTEQENIDRHARRLRARLDELTKNHALAGGLSIIRASE